MSGGMALMLGVLLDRLVGDPPALWRRVPHPVVLFGAAIGWFDTAWNRPEHSDARRRAMGLAAIAILTCGAALAGLVLERLLATAGPVGVALNGCIMAVFLAQRSLGEHVRAVATLLSHSLDDGRRAVSMIVGRDPAQLDASGVCRAAIESLAENTSDGVVAPIFYAALFGLPGLLAYKMVNTADSMIGHMSPRHAAFGMGAARLDDALNWLPARATALGFALVAASMPAWRIARRDAPAHRSPNAGWPEAAMAGALGLALGGPRRYGALVVDAPVINPAGREQANEADIGRALKLYRRLCNLIALMVAVLVLA